MERAALRLSGWYIRHYHIDQKVIIFAGPGNNGGDALAMARQLAERQYRVECFLLGFGKLSKDCALTRAAGKPGSGSLKRNKGESIRFQQLKKQDVVVDGIFGSGLSRIASGLSCKVIQHINLHPGVVVSIDIPSGLFGEDNAGNDYTSVIRATHTLTFQFPFLSFFSETHDPLWAFGGA